MVRVRGLGFAAVAVALAAASCQVLAGGIGPRTFDEPTDGGKDAPTESGTIRDAGTEAEAAVAPTVCGAAPPPPPAASIQGGTDISIIAAVRSVYYAADSGGGGLAPLGFDLDCVDTCPGPPSCKSAQKNCDAVDGRDLAGNYFLSAVDNFSSVTGQRNLNELAATGEFTVLLLIQGYNGAANDSLVTFSIFFSGGIRPGLEGDDAGVDASVTVAPKWDGTDVWTVDPTTIAGGFEDDAGVYHYVPSFTTNGYVTDYQLVATLPELQIGLGLGLLTFTNVIYVAQIVPQASGGYRLDGQLAGRMSIPSILAAASVIRDPLDPTRTKYLCGNDPTFQTFRGTLCGSADIMLDPSQDSMGDTCDSLSASLGLIAESAKLGPEFKAFNLTPGCDGGVEGCDQD